MKLTKRLFDLIFSSAGLLLMSPILLFCALAVKLSSSGPVFYRQVRVGKGGEDFHIFKFRTMVVDADKKGLQITSESDPRITLVGRTLRRTKLDELPQLINVLIGQMSLVGPRPEVRKYVDLYTPEQRQVLSVAPGITDPASIAYRHEGELLVAAPDPEALYINTIMPDKLRINLDYLQKQTVWTDFLIILKTFKTVLRS